MLQITYKDSSVRKKKTKNNINKVYKGEKRHDSTF